MNIKAWILIAGTLIAPHGALAADSGLSGPSGQAVGDFFLLSATDQTPEAPTNTAPTPAVTTDLSGEFSVPTRTYTLQECLQLAKTDPDRLLAQRIAVDQAATAVSLAKANLAPVLTSIARAKLTSNNQVEMLSSDQTVFLGERARAGVAGSYPIYDAGRRTALLRAAQAGLRGQQESVQSAQIEILEQVTAAYYQVLAQQRLLADGRLTIEETQAHLADAQAQFDLGKVTRGDVLTAQSILAAAQAEDAQRGAGLAAARAYLAMLIGSDPLQVVPAAVAPPETPGFDMDPAQLTAQAFALSPTRLQLVAEKESAESQMAAIRAEHAPTVTALVGAGFVSQDAGQDIPRSQSGAYALAGLEINLPLLEQAGLQAREHDQKNEIELRDAAIHVYENRVREEVVTATANYRATGSQVQANTQAVSAAEEAFRLAKERYAVGRGTQIDVLTAVTRLTSARDTLAEALNQRDLSAQTLRRLAGMDRL